MANIIEIEYVLRAAPTVLQQPRVVLEGWVAFQGLERCLLVGMNQETAKLRFTTHIIEVSAGRRTWVTSSGRVYETPSWPEGSAALRELYGRAARIHLATFDLTDVSEAFLERFQSAAAK
ncbi:MAG: hypothetical protein V4684_06040 [Pseudomonadota bacterium]